MWRRLAQWSGLVFALVLAWKLALLVFTAQPVPANDSFFYDGPVVNFLLNGNYTNPSLALTFPISGNELFSAYPPLYQFLLLGWMKIFGASALAAMWLHLALYATYMLTLFAILRRVNAPVWCIHLAGLFLLANTFHDRPDSLVHTLGMVAIYFRIRHEAGILGSGWLPAILTLLGMTAGPVIGAMYLFIIFGLTCLQFRATRRIFDLLPAVVMVVLPPLMIGAVILCRPEWWVGFMEHARQTPSLSNFRVPQLVELVKVFRTVPGIFAVAGLALLLRPKINGLTETSEILTARTGWVVALAAGGIIFACLFFWTANLVHVAGYLQPLIVGCGLAISSRQLDARGWRKIWAGLFVALGFVSSIRAIGQTTWGVACAADLNHLEAMRIVRQELETAPSSPPVICSAAYLYEAARHKNLRAIHSDWLGPTARGATFTYSNALVQLKPQILILTQFDYYRRYESILAEFRREPELVEIKIRNTAGLPPPDAFSATQKVVQHVSWAPVIVTLSWKSPGE